MRQTPRLLPLLAAAFLVPGCLPYDEQEIRFRIDAERDRMDLLLIDMGLHHDQGGWFGGGPEAAGKDLDRIAKGERFVSLLYGFLPFNIDDHDPPSNDLETRVAAHLNKNVSVEHGRFFRDADGRLCWWQCVRVSNLSGLLDLSNEAIRSILSEGKGLKEFRETFRLGDEESRALLRRAIAAREPFLLRRGGALAFRFPASRAGHRNLIAFAMDQVREGALDDARSKADLGLESEGGTASRPSSRKPSGFEQATRLLLGLEASFLRSGDAVELVLGNPEKREQKIALPPEGEYEENLAPLLQERKLAIHSDVTEETLRAAFDAFCAR